MNENIEQLLDELEVERRRFTQADEEVIQKLVDQLVELGVYPTTPMMVKYGYTAHDMVEAWGARWYIWSEPLACPKCKADWRDVESGPPLKREMGMYSDMLDRTYAIRCPDCGTEFGR